MRQLLWIYYNDDHYVYAAFLHYTSGWIAFAFAFLQCSRDIRIVVIFGWCAVATTINKYHAKGPWNYPLQVYKYSWQCMLVHILLLSMWGARVDYLLGDLLNCSHDIIVLISNITYSSIQGKCLKTPSVALTLWTCMDSYKAAGINER